MFCFFTRPILVPIATLLWCLGTMAGAGAQQSSVVTQKPGKGLRGTFEPKGTRGAMVSALRFRKKGKNVVVSLYVNAAIKADAFVLGAPYRVIVDLQRTVFVVGAAEKSNIRGSFVKAFRYGRFAPTRSRLVIDTKGPSLLTRMILTKRAAKLYRLDITITRTSAANFNKLAKAGLVGPPKPKRRPKQRKKIIGDKRNKIPVVVIDPGHGGVDPGAVYGKNTAEKTVVLAVGLELRKRLGAKGKFKVLMTRDSDEFVSLVDRRDFSEENNADLFLSLHADALGKVERAGKVSGATVYTLSDKASDAVARRFAQKENSADLAAGLDVVQISDQGQVRNILADLMRRETSAFSAHFRRVLLKRLRKQVRLSRVPARSAAFAVLKQTKTPSVLVELGYVSNARDRKNLMSRKWQRAAARSIAKAVEIYFSSRKTVAR